MSREARQRVAFRPGTRIGVIAASLAAAAALVLPTTALASTASIGSVGGGLACNTQNGPFDSVQVTSSGDRYVVPSGGTSITSWSVAAGGGTGPVGLEVWKQTAPLTFTLVGSSPVEPISTTGLNTFDLGPTSLFGPAIPVEAGDLIGLRVEGDFACWQQTADPTDSVWFDFPAIGSSVLLSSELNVAATVEVTAPAPNPIPTTADQCKGGGWQALTDNAGTPFKNQGDCVSFVATGGTNTAAGS